MTASPAGPGMPSEVEIARIVSVTGAIAPRTLEKARAILSLIRPAFEAQRAKLAQAVEAMEPFDDALGEDDEGYGGGLTVVMKWGACSVYSVTLEDLRDLRKAVRACEDRLDEASAASAAARGETR